MIRDMFSLVGYIRDLATTVLAKELPRGRGVPDKAVQDKYRDTLEAVPVGERDKAVKNAIKDIEDIIRSKDVSDDIADLYPGWKLDDFAEFLKYLKGEKTVKEKTVKEKKSPGEKAPPKGKFDVKRVRIFFSAPEENELKTFAGKANFQWVGFEIIFTDSDLNHFKYQAPVYSWGGNKAGGEIVMDAESEKTQSQSSKITVDEAKKGLPNPIQNKGRLYKSGYVDFYNIPTRTLGGGELNIKGWINSKGESTGDAKKYTAGDFTTQFISNQFYKLITKDQKIMPLIWPSK